MDCKNTDSKYFYTGNTIITPDCMRSLHNQSVDHANVQLPFTFKDYQKKKDIIIYNYPVELLKKETNVMPKRICL
jgi:hypothetical protein